MLAGGDTYVLAPASPKEKMLAYWFGANVHGYTAMLHGYVVGAFIMRDNQRDLGSHIANASYMVLP